MLNYFRKIALDQFLRSVLVLASGTLISQLIILATLPLITRLYTPAEYGTYSIYLSVIGILLMLVSFSYESAVTLPEDDKTASSVLGLCLLICSGVSIVSGLAIFLFQEPLSVLLQDQDLPHYGLLFTISLFFAGCYQILNYWLVRKKHFRKLARTRYTQSIGQVSSQLSLSLLSLGPLGLIAGDIIGRLGGLLPQWRQWRGDMSRKSIELSWEDIKDSAYRYRRFPLLSMASNILNSIGIYLPTIWLATFYGVHVAGWFALGQRILGSPMTLIMNSIRNVYLAESSEYMISNPAKLSPLFRRTVKQVFIVGLIIIAAFFVVGPAAFSFLFGEAWRQSGEIIRILSVMYLSQFVANSVGSTIDVMERQDLHLYREIIRTVIIAGALLLALYTHQAPDMAILFFSLASTLGYVLHLGMSWLSIKKYEIKVQSGEVSASASGSVHSPTKADLALGAGHGLLPDETHLNVTGQHAQEDDHHEDPEGTDRSVSSFGDRQVARASSDYSVSALLLNEHEVQAYELQVAKWKWIREQRELWGDRPGRRLTYAQAARSILQAARREAALKMPGTPTPTPEPTPEPTPPEPQTMKERG